MNSQPPASEPNSFSAAGAGADRDPLLLKVQPRPPQPPRDGLLNVALFGVVLGAVLTVVYSFFLSSYSRFDEYFSLTADHYHHILVPVFCVLAVMGALLLDRIAALGLLLILSATLAGFAGGMIYLLPGAVLACIWAARRDMTARLLLGFLLLVPGVIAVYYSLAALISYGARQPLPGMPLSLSPPLNLSDALEPMRMLPAALLGAWLLTDADGDPAAEGE